ncbi:general stress protein [Neobacillus sp. SAB-20_R2A]|uniref:general stress protein n=1 Tax=Neobacillus sp. SAB-20_R2A TaxID=3120519 RepID=UPI003C6E7C37
MDKHMKNVVGVYDTEQEAINAIDRLLDQGYHKNEISMIGKNVEQVSVDTGTAIEETAATGAAVCGVLGGIPGLLAGAGALAIPGIGPLVAAGPIAAGLMGAITGAGIGGLTGAFVGMGIPHEEAESYEKSVKEGKIIVLVEKRCDNRNDRNYLHEDTELDHPPLVGVDGRNRKEDGVTSEVPPLPDSSYQSREFGSSIKEDGIMGKSPSGTSLKEDPSTLKTANNSSMAQDYSEVKKLGQEMEQQRTEEELRDDHLKPDPLQSTKKA